VELAELADRAIDKVCLRRIRIVEERHVRLDGQPRLFGYFVLRETAEDGL
jgi:hypothetical protein